MRIAFLGSGNVATHFAQAFRSRGEEICQVWSPHSAHAERLARLVGAEPTDNLDTLCGNAEAYILAVPDNAISDLASRLSVGQALVLHTSGATPLSALSPAGTRCGVLWSPYSFVRQEPVAYGELPFCIEGCDLETTELIEQLARKVSPRVYRTNLRQRQYLHLAAVLANNFVSGLYAEAQQICREQSLPFDLLAPLILATARRARQGDVRTRLTGPAVRHDSSTLDAHRRLLDGQPALLALYDQMTVLLQEIAPAHD